MSEEENRFETENQQAEQPAQQTEEARFAEQTQVQPQQTEQSPVVETSQNKEQKPVGEVTEPTSPKRQTTTENTSQIQLSPKTDQSQKVISQQSPAVLKNKLDVLRKLYNDHLEKHIGLMQADRQYNEKKQQLEGFRTLLDAAQSAEAQRKIDNAQKLQDKQQEVVQLENRLQGLKSENVTAHSNNEKANNLNNEIVQATQKLAERQNEAKTSQINQKVQEHAANLQKVVSSLQYKKNLTEDAINGSRTKVTEQKNALQTLLAHLVQQTLGASSSSKLNELETKQKNIQAEIKNRQEEINRLKSQFSNVSTKQHHVQESVGDSSEKLNVVRSEVEAANKKKAEIEKQVENIKKEHHEASNKIKNNEKNIDKVKSKNHQLNDKVKHLQKEKNDLEHQVSQHQKKKPKFEEKVPEELLNLRKRKQDLEKQAKSETEKTEKQRTKEDSLVPLSVVQTTRARIAHVHERNQRHDRIVVHNEHLREENKKLDASKDQLEWETNPELRSTEDHRVKEQAKLSALEEEIIELRKKNIQFNNKIEEYANEYPEFRPEKKMKKIEPAPQPQPVQQKKQTPVVQEKNNNKKKKGNKSAQEIIQPVVQEQEKPAPVPIAQKTTSKKQQQKPGNNKNKKVKQVVQPEPQNVQPAKKQQVPKKQEAPKKQEPKKEEPKKQEPAKKVEQPKKEVTNNKKKNKK